MNNAQLTEKLKELLDINPPKSEIARLFMKAIDSGVLNYEAEEEDSYRTAKIIYHAILCEMAEQWKPLTPSNLMESKKLKVYL
ncbi:hypothetical protein [Chryseobacterium sp. ISL-6]|uniref:hypothetical protein n=1 Tax=Chryseobacterium sp. ISL-6 TaxID=2819143 RepID=UPI001BE6C4A6|nr:hypothetical protein [Chryseobacterium sp. ISL-6]MBT2621947.1 hypothetical protein [Chryseobacterium sp. ISL-6]